MELIAAYAIEGHEEHPGSVGGWAHRVAEFPLPALAYELDCFLYRFAPAE